MVSNFKNKNAKMEPRDIENPIAEADFRHQLNTLYAFLYNPMIHESGYITVSIHRTREGAEKALICHKNDIKEEWDNEDHIFAFDHFRDWEIEEIQILD